MLIFDKDIPGYEGLYCITIQGDVYSYPKKGKGGHNGLFMKPSINGNGYYHIVLRKNQKRFTFRIHRLVAEAFISNPDNKKTINHIDGDKLNNFVKNLEWNTYSENHLHRYRILGHKSSLKGKVGGLHYKAVKVKQYNLDGHLIKVWDSIADIKRELGIAHPNIIKVCQGKRKTAGGFAWSYFNS